MDKPQHRLLALRDALVAHFTNRHPRRDHICRLLHIQPTTEAITQLITSTQIALASDRITNATSDDEATNNRQRIKWLTTLRRWKQRQHRSELLMIRDHSGNFFSDDST
eukprot:5049326-Prorocentrum_lima.AAC.1